MLLIPQGSNFHVRLCQKFVSLIEVQLTFFRRTGLFSSNIGVPVIVFLNTASVNGMFRSMQVSQALSLPCSVCTIEGTPCSITLPYLKRMLRTAVTLETLKHLPLHGAQRQTPHRYDGS